MKVGERFEVKVLKLVSKGKGLALLEKRVVFIPFVLPDETVEIEIREIRKDYLRADKIRILAPSPFRIDPPCPVFEVCGGCQLQMIDYSRQLQMKSDLFKETLYRIGKVTPEITAMIPRSEPFHYRKKVRFKTSFENGKVVIGFYRIETNIIVSVEGCLVLPPLLNGLLKEVTVFLNQNPLSFMSLKELSFSLSTPSNEILIELNGKEIFDHAAIIQGLFNLPFNIKGIILSWKERKPQILGKRFISNVMKDPFHSGDSVKIRNSAGSFSQVNWEINLILIETLISWAKLSGKERILELYCGNGNFTLLLAKRALQIIAIEENPVAIEDLQINLRENNIVNCCVRKGSAKSILSRWDTTMNPIDLLIADPPREGMDRSSIQSILRIQPSRIFYISCDPATLARDLKALSPIYSVQRITPFDMFPQTSHIESLSELSLSK